MISIASLLCATAACGQPRKSMGGLQWTSNNYVYICTQVQAFELLITNFIHSLSNIDFALTSSLCTFCAIIARHFRST